MRKLIVFAGLAACFSFGAMVAQSAPAPDPIGIFLDQPDDIGALITSLDVAIVAPAPAAYEVAGLRETIRRIRERGLEAARRIGCRLQGDC